MEINQTAWGNWRADRKIIRYDGTSSTVNMWWRFFMFLSLASETSYDLILGMAITPLLSFNAASSLVSHEYHPMPDELTPSWKACGRRKTTLWWCYSVPSNPQIRTTSASFLLGAAAPGSSEAFQLHRFPSKMIQNVCVMIHHRSPRVPPEGPKATPPPSVEAWLRSPFWELIQLLSHEKLPRDWLEVVDQHIWIWCCPLGLGLITQFSDHASFRPKKHYNPAPAICISTVWSPLQTIITIINH